MFHFFYTFVTLVLHVGLTNEKVTIDITQTDTLRDGTRHLIGS